MTTALMKVNLLLRTGGAFWRQEILVLFIPKAQLVHSQGEQDLPKILQF